MKNREPCNLVSTTYSVEVCREAIVRFIIKDKMPFRVIKGEGFKEILGVFKNKFKEPSHVTLTRDILQLYEKKIN